MARALSAYTGLLVSAERLMNGAVVARRVDNARSRLNLVRELHRKVDVLRDNAGSKSERSLICYLNRLVKCVEADYREHGSEDFEVFCDFGISRNLNNGRFDERAVALAAVKKLAAVCDNLVYFFLYTLCRLFSFCLY